MGTRLAIGRDDSALDLADTAAVMEHLVSGRPLDPALVERIRHRSAQVMADIEHEHGLVDDGTFQALLDDEA